MNYPLSIVIAPITTEELGLLLLEPEKILESINLIILLTSSPTSLNLLLNSLELPQLELGLNML